MVKPALLYLTTRPRYAQSEIMLQKLHPQGSEVSPTIAHVNRYNRQS